MKKTLYMSLIFFILNSCNVGKVDMNIEKQPEKMKYLSGYEETIDGFDFNYHSFIPDANKSILVRTVDGTWNAKWKTAIVPENEKNINITFVWIGALAHDETGKTFDLKLNNVRQLTFKTGTEEIWKVANKNGVQLEFKSMQKDQYNDLFGYMFLTVPRELINFGETQLLEVIGENASSNSWYMTFKYKFDKIEISPKPGLLKGDDGNYQLVKVNINYLGDSETVEIKATGSKSINSALKLGYNSFDFAIPEVKNKKEISINVKIGKEENLRTALLKPVDKREIHILHHSHVDIGYTHVQDDVEQIQYENIKNALDYIEKTSDYPEESQYRWNVEVLWAVECFLDRASIEEKKRFEQAVKSGRMGMQALYGNILTGLCSPEEFYHLLDYSNKLEEEFNINITSAMITDVPGYSTGIVPALVNNGVKYFSVGPNNGDRIGHILTDWGDKPFYWESQSGEEKLLTWVTKTGYALFHGLAGGAISQTGQEKLLNYCQSLSDDDYPYEMVQIRYTIKSDNGPPDPELSKFVKEWNKKYISPKLVVSTSEMMLKKFEKKNKDRIPVYSGDFSPYWEDGAYSTAKETILNRKTAEKLVQTDVLFTMLKPELYSIDEMNLVWKNVLLYDEHTWGAHNSISEPDIPFVTQQWENKKKFAVKAAEFAGFIYDEVLKNNIKNAGFIEVFNTESWTRTDIVKIPADWNIKGNVLFDNKGDMYPLQKLSTGKNIFIAKNIRGLSSKCFQVKNVKMDNINVEITDNQLDNGEMKVSLDESGNIGSLIWNDIEFVNKTRDGLNNYNYIEGSDPKNAQKVKEVCFSIKENGPVMSSIIVESFPEGCNKMTQEIRLYKELNYIEIINTLNKKAIRDKEAVHFGFPFDVKDGTVNLDISWGMVNPEKDLLKGANKNYLTVDKGLDISNDDYGITLATPDACLIEIGEMSAEINHWMTDLPKSQTIYSYALNNYWHTNYKADQSGIITFRYLLKPHLGNKNGHVKKFNIEQTHPLIARKSKSINNGKKSLFRIKDNDIIVSSLKPMQDGNISIRLFNTSNKEKKLDIQWGKLQPEQIFMIDKSGEMIALPNVKQMKPFAILDLVIK